VGGADTPHAGPILGRAPLGARRNGWRMPAGRGLSPLVRAVPWLRWEPTGVADLFRVETRTYTDQNDP
jgi:hypothetical protein